jgi:hypothetical protein
MVSACAVRWGGQGWPAAFGGLVLALDGPVHRGKVDFELAPPPRRVLRLVFGLGLPLSGCLLRELAPLQLGPGFPAASLLLLVSTTHFS